MNKNKNKNVKAAAPTKTNSKTFSERLANTKGRMIGITTVTRDKVNRYNGQVVSQSPQFVSVRDNNLGKVVKIGKSTILSLSGV